jgi:hypothetical protein
VRARAAFAGALRLDPQYVPAVGGLIEVAALSPDSSSLRTQVGRYLVTDSVSDDAWYVRWRLASLTGDERGLRNSRIRLHTLDADALARIRLMAQLDGRALADGQRASDLIVTRASTGLERQLAFHSARQLALNRGQPLEAARIAKEKRRLEPNADLQRGFAIRDALYWNGDTASAIEAARAFESMLAGQSPEHLDDRRSSYIRFSAALWRLSRGDTTRAANDIRALRRSPTGRDPQSQLLDALLANIVDRPDADVALARLDSLALVGFGPSPHVINLVSARIHERRGDLAGALAALRRGRWYFPPENLSTYDREEGRLSLLTGDTAGATRAWTHYLALRADPEPSVRPEVERIRAQLRRIQKP